MRIYLASWASLSKASFVSRRSFERYNAMPSTVFQYFYQLQLKELRHGSSSCDIGSLFNKNSSFRRYKRKEWELLSMSKKRLYHALYFHFTKINYRTLSHEELAKRLEIPIPAASEYLLFRNQFKSRFDQVWEERKREKSSACLQKAHFRTGSLGLIRVSRRISRNLDDAEADLTRRFQDMCRECRRTWRDMVDDEQRAKIADKLGEERKNFEAIMKNEIQVLNELQGLLTTYLTNFDAIAHKALDFERRGASNCQERLDFLLAQNVKD
ncbi:LADA_0D07316g1_1 [Lachancea dasiensis]|uniref:LADA_0D07316g1_1 n=1 Tax=Lachancea dasiensis TaxID=1072105 RepID=A0A1G4J6P9_9SACH|nr:LADA_0D07316g1_1 [Lachancea dasiensis]